MRNRNVMINDWTIRALHKSIVMSQRCGFHLLPLSARSIAIVSVDPRVRTFCIGRCCDLIVKLLTDEVVPPTNLDLFLSLRPVWLVILNSKSSELLILVPMLLLIMKLVPFRRFCHFTIAQYCFVSRRGITTYKAGTITRFTISITNTIIIENRPRLILIITIGILFLTLFSGVGILVIANSIITIAIVITYFIHVKAKYNIGIIIFWSSGTICLSTPPLMFDSIKYGVVIIDWRRRGTFSSFHLIFSLSKFSASSPSLSADCNCSIIVVVPSF